LLYNLVKATDKKKKIWFFKNKIIIYPQRQSQTQRNLGAESHGPAIYLKSRE